MIVVDANILIRAVLGRRARQLLDHYAARGLRFFTVDVAFDDANKYLPALLKNRGRPGVDFAASLAYLRGLIETIDRELYAAFETEARNRLHGARRRRLASASLRPGTRVRNLERGRGFLWHWHRVWTTSRIEIFLESALQSKQSEQE
jgi:hypothetical protein